jgi:hypothetical protein
MIYVCKVKTGLNIQGGQIGQFLVTGGLELILQLLNLQLQHQHFSKVEIFFKYVRRNTSVHQSIHTYVHTSNVIVADALTV